MSKQTNSHVSYVIEDTDIHRYLNPIAAQQFIMMLDVIRQRGGYPTTEKLKEMCGEVVDHRSAI